MNNKLFGLIIVSSMLIFSIAQVSAFELTPEIKSIYSAKDIPRDVKNYDLQITQHAHEHKGGNRDHNLYYEVWGTEIMHEKVTPFLISSGQDEVRKTIQIPSTVTHLEFRYSGADNIAIFGIWTPDAWWKDVKAELYVDSYPNYSYHTVEFSSVQHKWPNYNDPYIKVDGHTDVFDHGYGKIGYLSGKGENKW